MPIYADFSCTRPGENSFATCKEGMSVGTQATINGNTDLSGIVAFNDHGCVYTIKLVDNPTWGSAYDYEIQVDGQGPKGVSGGKGYLYFTDATGDVYSLSLYKSGRDSHVVDYSSRAPEITTITWSNKSR